MNGRQTSNRFNVIKYGEIYPDITQAFGNDFRKYYVHYLLYGLSEGRIGNM